MLGLNMKCSQTWDYHLSSGPKAILPALRKQLGLLHRIGQNMDEAARLKLANCLIMSRMSYMICIWGNTHEAQVRKAQTVQNTAGRFVTGQPKYTRQKDILDGCGWLKIKDLTEYHSLCQLWKIVRWGCPQHLKDKITTTEEDKLITKNPRLQLTGLTFRCKSVQQWNGLPEYLRTEKQMKRFKINPKKWLKDRNKNEDNNIDETATQDRPGRLLDVPPGQQPNNCTWTDDADCLVDWLGTEFVIAVL